MISHILPHPMQSQPQVQSVAGSPKASKRNLSPSAYRKPCSLCSTPNDILVRCQIDPSGSWNFVCPGQCWKRVSGGVIDGDDAHPHYKYGGMWKNKHAGVSAKKPKSKKAKTDKSEAVGKEWQPPVESEDRKQEDIRVSYTRNDRVRWEGKEWVCRRGHESDEKRRPGVGWTWWKEVD